MLIKYTSDNDKIKCRGMIVYTALTFSVLLELLATQMHTVNNVSSLGFKDSGFTSVLLLNGVVILTIQNLYVKLTITHHTYIAWGARGSVVG
jgi:hypothetical protein